MYLSTGQIDAGKSITYNDLIAHFKDTDGQAIGKQQCRTKLSALSQFQSFCGRTGDDVPGPEMDGDFEYKLKEFLESRGTSRGYRAGLKSHLSAWQKLHRELIATRLDPPRFSGLTEAIDYYFEKARALDPLLNRTELARLAGVSRHQMGDGRQYLSFRPSSYAAIERLEPLLKAPKGALTQFCFEHKSIPRSDPPRTAFDVDQRNLLKVAYLQRKDQITDHYLAEWRSYFQFKSVDVVERPLKRAHSQSLRPIAEYGGAPWILPYISTDDGEQYSPTAGLKFKVFRSFFGALFQVKLPSSETRKYDPTAISLAWMGSYRMIQDAVRILLKRYSGVYTNTIKNLLNEAQSLVHPKHGYLTQHLQFASRMVPAVPEAQWEGWCSAQSESLKYYVEQLEEGEKFQQTRPTLEDGSHIWEYLNWQHPTDVLRELVDNISEFLKKNPLLSSSIRKPLERDLFLIQMIRRQPLRLKMFSIMTYKADGTGNLYKRADGTWAIKFQPRQFKNFRRRRSSVSYDAAFEPEFSDAIADYLRDVRPWFKDKRPVVFPVRFRKDRQTKIRSGQLAQSFRRRTSAFIPGCLGFGPHAARHLVATDYIRNHEEGWQTAAAALHDTLAVVLKKYAFIKKDDQLKHMRAYNLELDASWLSRSRSGTLK